MCMANDATRQPTAVLANLFAVALVFALLFEALRRRPLVLAPSGEGRCDDEKQEEEGGRHDMCGWMPSRARPPLPRVALRAAQKKQN